MPHQSGIISLEQSSFSGNVGQHVIFLIIFFQALASIKMQQRQSMNLERNLAGERSGKNSFSLFQSPSSSFVGKGVKRLQKYVSNRTLLISLIVTLLLLLNWLFIRVNFDGPASSNAVLPTQHTVIPTSASTVTSSTQTTNFVKTETARAGRFPKIFWIYTENEFDTESMNEQIYLYYFNDTAQKFGYEVRTANSWNSYDWLSQKTIARISKAMQNSKVDQTVHNVLKLALLMENGGILVNQFDISFLGDSFAWIEDMFNENGKGFQQKYECQPSKSFLYMFEVNDQVYGKRYMDPFIAAVPGSLILNEAFDLMMTFIMEGTFPYGSDFNIIQTNKDLGVDFMINSFEETINMAIYNYKKNFSPTDKMICNKYGIQTKKIKSMVQITDFTSEQMSLLMNTGDPEGEFPRMSGMVEVNLVRGLNRGPISKLISDMIDNIVNNRNHPIDEYSPGSIVFRILNSQVNRETFLTTPPERQIQLCVIIMNELNKLQIDESMQLLTHQTYKQWKQIMFTNNINGAPKGEDPRFIFLNSTKNQVRNIQLAVTKYCDKQNYAVLLNSREKFSSLNALAEIARATAPRDVVGAFVTLDQQGRIKIPKEQLARFHRGRDAIVNPKIMHLQNILNHMRIFSIESFRYIPQFDLRDIHGQYFNDRLIFLMTLLEMIRTEFRQASYFYIIKRYSSLWNIPRRMVVIAPSVKIKTSAWQQVDRNQLKRTRARLQCEQVQESVHNIMKWKIPFPKLLAFNNGDQFTPVDLKKGPEIIPKVIHQVWLGTNDLPPAKKYFYRKTKLIYPNYEMKLWREENITRESFPLTYDVIRNLIDFNKRSPYNKLATVTDIIRHELLYHEGGFWKDAGMNMLRPIFDKFTKYKIAIAVDKTFRYRWLQGMCFFANAPKIENMWRITNYRNINRMRIYHSYASSIAGPIDFRQFIVGQEEYDPEILCMSYDTFYPAQVTEHPEKDLCTKRLQELDQKDQYEISQNGWYLLSNCSKLYPYSYAVEHNRFGDSWSRRKDV